MQISWILIADSSRARIFERHGRERHFKEIEDFVNPAGRVEDNALRTDERGRFYGKGERYQGHTVDPAVFPVEHENEIFSRTVAQYLEKARTGQRFQRLRIIAAPKFLGLIRSNLSKEVQKMVEEETPKDISTFTLPEIEGYIEKEERR